MLNRLSKLVAGILIAGSLTALVWAQAAPAWKDQGESDIGLAAGNEKDPAKQLDLLKKWEQQYPESALKSQRTLMTANALMSVMGAAYGKTDPAVLAAGEKAGKQLEDHFKDYFDDSVKPAAGDRRSVGYRQENLRLAGSPVPRLHTPGPEGRRGSGSGTEESARDRSHPGIGIVPARQHRSPRDGRQQGSLAVIRKRCTIWPGLSP